MSTARPICPPDHKHAETSTCYTGHKCGCAPCREANTERSFYRRHMVTAGRTNVFEQIIDGRGVRRRLQALVALGYSARRLGWRLDVTADQVLLWLERDRVTATTHQRIVALYDELKDTTPPEGTTGDRISAHRARSTASRRGWAAPLDWDDIDEDDELPTGIPVDIDEIAIALAVDGHQVLLTREERHIVVRTLNARGYTDTQIAHMAGCTSRTVLRDRIELDIPAAVGPDRERIAS